MLKVECPKCGNDYDLKKECDCSFGYVYAPDDQKVYVNVYSITRHFGGYEEGGWYFDWYNCIETVPCKNKYSDEIQEDLEEAYENHKRGDISSVRGGVDILVLIEDEISKSETKERPIYE